MESIKFKLNTTINYSNASAFIKNYSSKYIQLFKKVSGQKTTIIKKACHCNKIFLRKTRLILLLNHFIPRCPYYNTYFAFRRTGIHPPFVIS